VHHLTSRLYELAGKMTSKYSCVGPALEANKEISVKVTTEKIKYSSCLATRLQDKIIIKT
jgi:hypothetical protein